MRVRRRKAPGMNGPSPIEWPDIDAFIRHSGESFEPFEVRLIEDLDDTYLASLSAEASEEDKQQALRDDLLSAGKPRAGDRPVSGETHNGRHSPARP